MIRVSNIDDQAKTCDFKMDGKDAYVVGYSIANLQYNQDSTVIIVPGSILTQGADAGTDEVNNKMTGYPVSGGGELSQALADVRATV